MVRVHRLARGVLAAALAAAARGVPAAPAEAPLPPPEVRHRLLTHGPWPPPRARDVSNRVSGRAEAIEFGYRMFREPRMSANGYVACISCHQTDRGYTDGIARAQALGPLPRNTPSLLNLSGLRWHGWGGSADSLWMAALRPMLDVREFGADPRRIAHVVRTGDGLACRYRLVFGASPHQQSERTVMVNTAKAIAAFVETLDSGRTPFDDWRDALARGDATAAARYPAAARRGAELFVGKAGCDGCHAGPAFSDGRFHATGLSYAHNAGARHAADRGRADGVVEWRSSAFRRDGNHSDRREAMPADDTRDAASGVARFRTPLLRNVAVTAPYGHDGALDTLAAAIVQHERRSPATDARGSGEAPRVPPLSAAEVSDLVAFLHTLTDVEGAARRFPVLPRLPCPATSSGG